MKLYRGDNITNTTEPGRYHCDGIRSKSFGQGSPAYIEAKGLLENIRRHVNPVSKQDFEIYNKTEFISFSTSRERALFWLASQNSLDISICQDNYKETRYLFMLDIEESQLQPVDSQGTMFLYHFACNPDLKEANSDNILEQAMFKSNESNRFLKSCPVCNKNSRSHSLVLIDTTKYLQIYKTNENIEGAIINAQSDQEWLLLPTDNLTGFSGTTIPRADFWAVEHYTARNEHRLEDMHRILGMEYDQYGNPV